jgi:hypothetical protein
VIGNNSPQTDDRISTIEMVWAHNERYPKMVWQVRTREETQRKTPTDFGRRDTEDLEGKMN